MPFLTNRAARDLGKLPTAMQEKARATIARIDSEPLLGHKLLGKLEGIRSARLGRSHRILYRVDADKGPVVLTIVARKDAYR